LRMLAFVRKSIFKEGANYSLNDVEWSFNAEVYEEDDEKRSKFYFLLSIPLKKEDIVENTDFWQRVSRLIPISYAWALKFM